MKCGLRTDHFTIKDKGKLFPFLIDSDLRWIEGKCVNKTCILNKVKFKVVGCANPKIFFYFIRAF